MAVRSIPIKDGVVDVVYSPDDGGYYLQRTIFSRKISEVSQRTYRSEREAVTAYETNRARWTD